MNVFFAQGLEDLECFRVERREIMIPNYKITEEILNLVQKISELATQLSFETRKLHLRKENRIRSIQSSLAIENNSLSLEQVTDVIEGKRVLGPLKDIHEVQNAYEAYEKVFRLNPYSIDDFLLAHRLLTQDLVKHPGQFRLGDVGIFDGTGKVVHLGARPQFVPNLVSDLFAWAKASQISDIVKSCIVHFELEIIHPFEDGNGRMGRMWQSLILSRWNPLFEWLPVESVIYRHQSGYYQALTESNEANDSTKFIQFMLEAILETLLDYSQQKNDSTEKSVKLLLKPRELSIFEKIESYLVENYQITTAVAQELTGLSAATMRRYLQIFVNQGLLEKSGTTKNTLYSLIIRSFLDTTLFPYFRGTSRK